MRFLIDECLPPALARRLNAHGRFPVDHVFDYRTRGESDQGIKLMAVTEGFVVVTRDREFIPSGVWQRTYLDEQLSALILVGGLAQATLAELEAWCLQQWSRIEEVFDAASGPTVVRAYPDGRFNVESEGDDGDA